MSISGPVPFFITQALFQKLRNVENKNGMSRVVTLYLRKTDCTNLKKSSQLMCFCSQKSLISFRFFFIPRVKFVYSYGGIYKLRIP